MLEYLFLSGACFSEGKEQMRLRSAIVWRTLDQALAATHSCHEASLSGPAPTWFLKRRLLPSRRLDDAPDISRPLQRYEGMLRQGLIQHDVQQHTVARMLDNLLIQLKDHQIEMERYQVLLNKWTEQREQQKKAILKAQAEVEAEKTLQQITLNNRKGIYGWWSRKIRSIKVERGAGRMVARINREKQLDSLVGPRPPLPPSPQGLYLYGNVGCGKTFLMDLFFNSSDGVVKYRRRMHFHAAMLEVHDRLHKMWKQRSQKVEEQSDASLKSKELLGNQSLTLEMAAKAWLEEEEQWENGHESELSALAAVADDLFGDMEDGVGASILCFDEVQVVDVFTAVALAAILSRLIMRGTVIVATSNRAPKDLNKDGLQKEIFTTFIATLEKHCHSVLVGVDKDYRRVLTSSGNGEETQLRYFWPLGKESQNKLDQLWTDLVLSGKQHNVTTASIPVMFARALEVPESCNGVARFSFEELCSRPLGAADYVSVAQNYHTIFITNIPLMSMRNSDQARRFITLVDELYNHHCQLVCTAAAPVDELFLGTDEGPLIDFESLQFETEAEGNRLRRDVLVSGNVAPLAATKEEKSSIEILLSGREELFAFRRAVSRLLEMESPIYLQALPCHPKFTSAQVMLWSDGLQ